MARPRAAAALLLLGGALLGPVAEGAEGAASARSELERFARALEQAVRRVSPASAAPMGAGEACHGYRLRGYGAVFVLAPRLLPAGPRPGAPAASHPGGPAVELAIAALEDALKHTDSPPMRAQLARHLELLRDRRSSPLAPGEALARAAQEEASLRQVEAEARALEQQAEGARQAAERAIEEVGRELRSQLADDGARAAASEPDPWAADPARPLSGGPPPWTFWFEAAAGQGPQTPEALVREVRGAVTGAIETHGIALRSLDPEEFLTVAVDFLARRSFGGPETPVRTLIVRVRKRALVERGAGRLAPEEFRQRFEAVEY